MNVDATKELQAGLARLREFWVNQAETRFRRVLAGDPENVAALHLLGVTACKLGRKGEGVALIRRALELQPRHTAAQFDLEVAIRDAPPHGDTQRYSVDNGQECAFKLVDYEYRAQVRYGAGRAPHTGLDKLIRAGRPRYAAFIQQIAQFYDTFAGVTLDGDYASRAPFWLNTWFPPLDGMALHAMLATRNPAQLVEIGSGMSTKFARQAIERHQLRTRIVSIDPRPRSRIDGLADRNVRAPLESVDPREFDALSEGDILFLDSSHRAFQNSDVTAFFLDVLPRLRPGVMVHLHDIYLPWDYPAGHLWRLWNEQYLLAATLLAGGGALAIEFPCWFGSQDPALAALINGALRRGPLDGLSVHGASFWMVTKVA
jgi:hypothetical protein